jgi:uncharacterized membrane protein
VVAAFVFVAGYVGTNLLTELARRNPDPEFRRSALAFSTMFDRRLNIPGATVVAPTGLLAVWAFGYSFLAPWVVAAILLYLVLPLLGGLVWARVGRRIDQALAADDQMTVDAVLCDPRNVAVSRIENLVVLAIIALMVLRPTF